jgi:hypothetical protein
MRVTAFGAVPAKAPVAQKGELSLGDPHPRKDPRQHEVKHSCLVVEGTAGHPKKRNIADIGCKEHGSRKDRRPIMKLVGAGFPNPVTRDVVGIHTHAARQQEKVAVPFELGADR